jgi:hypothetical protein
MLEYSRTSLPLKSTNPKPKALENVHLLGVLDRHKACPPKKMHSLIGLRRKEKMILENEVENTAKLASKRTKKYLAKKYLAMILVLLTLIFSVGPIGSGPLNSVASAASASAQTRRYRRTRRHRSFWQRHRDKLTVAGTTAGGAGLGALAGGKKGAVIGSLVGAGGGALYTYKIRKRHRHRRY